MQQFLSDPWFASLSAKQQQALYRASVPSEVAGGMVIWTQGEALGSQRHRFMVLESGLLRLSSLGHHGNESVLSYIKPGQWFGELCLLDGRGHLRDLHSEGPSRLRAVPAKAFAELMQDGDFARRVFDLHAGRHRFIHSLLEDFTLRSVKARTARRLLWLACDDDVRAKPKQDAIDVSHDALASMLGITRQTLGIQLRQLSQAGAIAQGYGQIIITSLVALMAEASAA